MPSQPLVVVLDRDPFDIHRAAAFQVHNPGVAVQDAYPAQGHVPTVLEQDDARAEFGFLRRVIARAQVAGGLAVQCAFAHHGDLTRAVGEEQTATVRVLAIPRVGAGVECRALFQPQRHLVNQFDCPGELLAPGNDDGAAAGLGAGVNRLLNRCCFTALPTALATEFAYIELTRSAKCGAKKHNTRHAYYFSSHWDVPRAPRLSSVLPCLL